MKDEPRTPLKHEHEHAVPTVIHHPEEDLPLLARWLKHAMENPLRFWSLIIGLVVVVVGLSLLSTGLGSGRTASNVAWTELEVAKTAGERVEIANKYPNTAAERWALLQAATEYYNTGFADLPANRDVALAQLKLALKYFEQVAKESPKDAPQARAAAFGVARTHEARNEIEKAVTQYQSVAKSWPDTEEGREAKKLAELLQKPENVAFYKELYAFKPVETTLPPLGQGSIPLPPGHPSTGTGSLLLPPPPPSSVETPKMPAGDEATKAPAPAPAGDEKPKANPAPASGLPDDVFAPSATTPTPAPAPTTTPTPEPKKDEPKP
ncbi:hypothetical protein SAMN05444166_0716 [Singulisphaera sp. GP187]|uniref:tetratricopeptide repeat protein n=1 Tax=Singulisphaera sp. GP187 TaxID=1882752 RepID=UPI000928D4CF|nr:hypothetical protein [Singulisphaera sp. GP187]SIN76523.1 hypothetical protein SAMN05444166_0716 [Singulisphaera sp. GP187]